ncbi:hypothetical protein DERF_009954 [Dermatophagoides farinae]|uniref:Uncharacterized protein n=1 Tax=Dermatophagoides farinae TaxID=6954 RepID=A0A922HXY5_DERFA|nr:hypothetical protein DERF_009954 [Dermatophagoides farinae]
MEKKLNPQQQQQQRRRRREQQRKQNGKQAVVSLQPNAICYKVGLNSIYRFILYSIIFNLVIRDYRRNMR